MLVLLKINDADEDAPDRNSVDKATTYKVVLAVYVELGNEVIRGRAAEHSVSGSPNDQPTVVVPLHTSARYGSTWTEIS